MKKFTMLAVFAFIFIAFSAVAYAGSQDFQLVNETGITLVDLRVTPSHEKHWGDDLISGSLPNGDAINITFSGYSSDVESWDLAATADNGVSLEWHGLLLNNIRTISLQADGTAKLL